MFSINETPYVLNTVIITSILESLILILIFKNFNFYNFFLYILVYIIFK